MKSNKTVLIFLIKFFGTYIVLFLLYSIYLNLTQEKSAVFSCAPITKSVAKHSKVILDFVGYSSEIVQSEIELSINLIVRGKPLARVIEGCNSISIIILFIAFIVAFSSTFKTTLFYIIFGSLLIYSINIVRIVIIAIALYEFPEYEHLLHNYLFPAIIYGVTFLLWFIWVRKFSKVKK
ncbi:exosortase family protein XrtF [Lutibacter sp. TH_r2]|uniref:exosortase family protein XrtF n=1 Tax=Lutibacter sp. TH_r2 TaxID=3082083 RepID=UPI0029537D83|nr:exosortase family protein XrtF [Lutibacter sp. TH_r2]MDV7187059.1 exosortase family protein XrtF [Lutibacter sp. TH_r2]